MIAASTVVVGILGVRRTRSVDLHSLRSADACAIAANAAVNATNARMLSSSTTDVSRND